MAEKAAAAEKVAADKAAALKAAAEKVAEEKAAAEEAAALKAAAEKLAADGAAQAPDWPRPALAWPQPGLSLASVRGPSLKQPLGQPLRHALSLEEVSKGDSAGRRPSRPTFDV